MSDHRAAHPSSIFPPHVSVDSTGQLYQTGPRDLIKVRISVRLPIAGPRNVTSTVTNADGIVERLSRWNLTRDNDARQLFLDECAATYDAALELLEPF